MQKIMKHCTLTSAYFILQDTKTVELCDGYAMTTCAWYFATSCRKVTGHWKRGSIDAGIEVKVRARNIWLQSKLQGLCARMLFLIMRLPEIAAPVREDGVYQWGRSWQPPAGDYYLAERGNPIYMDDKKLLRYSMQLSMLKQLLSKKLINENEYQIIQKKLMKDYGIISNITAWRDKCAAL